MIKHGNATYIANLRKNPAIYFDKNPVFLRIYPNPKMRNKGRKGIMKLNMKREIKFDLKK